MAVVLQLLFTFVDDDYIRFCHTKTDAADQAAVAKGVGVRADLPTFDHNYTLVIETLHAKSDDPKAPSSANPYVRVELPNDKKSIGNYFDENGYFYEEEFAEEVKKLLKKFEAKVAEKKAKKE